MNKPNERHELFCREYVRRPVGSAAAIAAGYSEDNAAAQACRLLARGDIQARIAVLRDEVAASQVQDCNAVLARLQSIYELALEQNQLNIALRAVAMQMKFNEAIPSWQRSRPAQPVAAPDLDAILSAIEESLPPEDAGAAMPAPPAPEAPAAPEPADAAPEKPINASKGQSFEHFSTGPGHLMEGPDPADGALEKPINAK